MQKIVHFYIDTCSLHKKTHMQVLLSYMQRFYLLVQLTFEIQAHVNTQTNHHSLHTFRQKKITHYRLAFIRLYIQSYKRAFHTDI